MPGGCAHPAPGQPLRCVHARPRQRRSRLHRLPHRRPAHRRRARRRRRRQLRQRQADGRQPARGADRRAPAGARVRPAPTATRPSTSSPHEQIDAVIHFAGLKAVGESVRDAAGVLREQPRLDVLAGAGDAAGTACDKLVFSSLRHGLRRARHGAVTEDLPDVGDQPLRLDQGDDRADPARRRARPSRGGGSRCCATSTPSARTPPARSARTRRASPTT